VLVPAYVLSASPTLGCPSSLVPPIIVWLNFGNRIRSACAREVGSAENHWVTLRELDEPERR
jgi:hypothetical protein